MALTFYWRAESGTLSSPNDDYSASDTSGALTGTATFDAAAGWNGNGILLTNTVTGYYAFGATSIATRSVGCCAFLARYPTTVPSTSGYQYGPLFIGSTNDSVGFETQSGGGFRLKTSNATNGSIVLNTSGTAMSTNTWYGAIIRWDFPGNRRYIAIHALGDLVNPIASNYDDVTDMTNYQPGTEFSGSSGIRIGKTGGATQPVMHIDNVLIGSAYDDPLNLNLLITAASQYTESSGSPLILPHRSGGGMIDLSGNFRG